MIGNLAFRVVNRDRSIEEFLDLNPSTSVGIEMNSPLFDFEQTRGTITYNITIPWTKKNSRLLGFPEILSNETSAPIEIPCQFFILGVLWKVGQLRYRGFTGREYQVNFQTDAGDFQSRTRDRLLTNLDLGAIAYATNSPYYTLFPVRNKEFYTPEQRPGYNGYMNYYDGGFQSANSPQVPFPYLPWIMSKSVANYGYRLSGSWLEDGDAGRTVIYNTREMQQAGWVNIAHHVPEIKQGEFMQAVRSQFALGYVFDANTQTINIIQLKDVVSSPAYLDWTKKADATYSDEPVDYNGFRLVQNLEDDELNKSLSTAWSEYKIGGGRDTIQTACSTLHMVREQDSVKQSRSWLIPATSQKGNSPAYNTGENKFSLRLLRYYGMQKDTQNQDYPLGSAISENYAGALLPGSQLQWQGEKGIYNTQYKEWLAFLSAARPIERNVRMDIADLITLDPTKKVMIDGVKMFWSKISLSVSMKDGIGKAKVQFLKTKL